MTSTTRRQSNGQAWHEVTKRDQLRIKCQECINRSYDHCDKPAVACQHSETRLAISFFYYCGEHATQRGFQG